MPDTLIYEVHGHVARLILNRPEKRNALDTLFIEEVHEALYKADVDENIRVVILSGNGPSFCGGHDLAEPWPDYGPRPKYHRMSPAPEVNTKLEGPEGLLRIEDHIYLQRSLSHRNMRTPTIAQVHGWCVSGGLMLACMCDIIVASEDAKFANPVVRQTNAGVELLVEPWELGIRRAKEFLWTGDPIGAAEGHQLGLVNHVVAREELDEYTMKLAQRIAMSPPQAVQMVKRSINHTWDLMGQRDAWEYHFILHNLAHWTDEALRMARELNQRGLGPKVKDFLDYRDSEYRDRKADGSSTAGTDKVKSYGGS